MQCHRGYVRMTFFGWFDLQRSDFNQMNYGNISFQIIYRTRLSRDNLGAIFIIMTNTVVFWSGLGNFLIKLSGETSNSERIL